VPGTVPVDVVTGRGGQEVAEFLEGALPFVEQEPQTTAWFTLRPAPWRFAIFDALSDEARTKPERWPIVLFVIVERHDRRNR
jgi:hypothetical protein